MLMRKNADFWIGLILLAFCAWAAMLTTDISGGGTGTEAGPNFFPWVMIVGIAILSAALLARSLLRAQPQQGTADGDRTSLRMLAKLGFFLLLMLIYAACYVEAGYLISTGVFFVVAMLALGERRILHVVVIPAGIIAGVYLVFTQIMKVYMP